MTSWGRWVAYPPCRGRRHTPRILELEVVEEGAAAEVPGASPQAEEIAKPEDLDQEDVPFKQRISEVGCFYGRDRE